MNADGDAVARLLRARAATAPLDLPVSGTSMARVIATGSEVRIVADDQPRPGQIWAFVDDDGHVVVHRIREVAGDRVIGRGSGNDVDDEPVARTRLVGRVVSAVHGGRSRRFGPRDRWIAWTGFALRRRLRRLRRRFG